MLASARTWNDYSGIGDDDYGFSAVAAGSFMDGSFQEMGESASFWTKTSSAGSAYVFGFSFEYSAAGMMFSSADEARMRTVRCIKDDAPSQSVSSN